MLRDITLGQYYRADSVIHRLDPRVKIAGTLAYMISLFVCNNLICYALAIVFLGTIIGLSKVPVKFMLRGMQSVVFLLIITVIYNVFLSSGTTIVKFWVFTITYEGIINAVFMFFRLMLLIMGSSVMTLTTTPNQLTDGLESLMRPLKIFKVPVHEMAMMMSIALRFIPILMEETDKIMKAQMARGADFETGGLIARAKAMVPLLVPLFVGAFRRAEELALAMDARCYRGGKGRTRMKQLKFQGIDGLAALVIAALLAAVILLNRLNLF